MGSKLGPINGQLPPTRVFDCADLAGFLDLLPDSLNSLPRGYPKDKLDRWATRLCRIAKDRAVFVFVIAGHKVANPAAAQGLLQRLA